MGHCGIIPKRYQKLNLSELDTYFAMARGYQGEAGDVKALAMKKWFNTNYHYIVPEVEDDTVISFSGKKILSEFEEAKELGISVKPVVPGAYTLLKLCRYIGTKTAEDENFLSSVLLKANESLFLEGRDCVKEEVKNRLKQVKDEDYVRTPARKERQKRQKEVLGLPIFPTTTIGSFPQTKDVKANRSAYRRGEKTKEEYVAFNREKISECIRWQEEIGLDVLVHGEYERNDMVEYFGESLGEFLFTKLGWVQSYGTRCVKPPIIWGDVYRDKLITVDWSVFAQSQTDKIMKGMLTGPITILNWSFPREDISIRHVYRQSRKL